MSKLEFQLIPVSREHYNSQIRIRKKKGGRRQLKYDELEIAYFARKGIDVRPNIKGVIIK